MAEEQSLATTGAGTETKKIAGAITSMGIDELVFNMAKGIADGQARLDQTCMALAVQMGDAQIEFGKIAGTNDPDLISLIELGFTPNFYQFVDTILEVRVSVSSQYEEEQETSTSEVDQQSSERESQEQYANSRDNRYSGYGYSGGYSVGWGWGGYGVGWGGSGYGYSGGSSASERKNANEKSKTVKVNTVDASFSSKYAYSVEASSLIKTKIVPVPPPQVLEEFVQGKAKERKEWAKRFALLRFSKNLLPAIADSGSKAAKIIEPFLTLVDENDNYKVPVPFTHLIFDKANTLSISLVSLKDEYDKLTNDHWSVIENVKDRRLIDNVFENFSLIPAEIETAYPTDKNKVRVITTDKDDQEKFYRKLITCHGRLTDLKEKIDEIMKRLPLTPEEMAREEEKAANQS
jgi:hypothetical protein